MRKCANSFFFLILAIILACAVPSAAQEDTQDQVDGWNETLDEITDSLSRPDISEARLLTLRETTLGIHDAAQLLSAELRPGVAAAAARVRSLAPESDTSTAETEELRLERESEESDLARLTGIERQVEVVALRADQILRTISNRRSQNFTTQLLERSDHIWSPSLWREIAEQLPHVFAETALLFGDWLELIAERADRPTVILLIVLAIMLPFALWVARRFLRRTTEKIADATIATDQHKVTAAVWIVATNIATPTVIVFATIVILEALGFLPAHVRLALTGILLATVAFTMINGLALAILAPARPSWRLAMLEDKVAVRLYGTLLVVAFLYAALPIIDHFVGLTAAGPSLAVGLGGTIAIAIAITMIIATRIISSDRDIRADVDGDDSIGRIWRWAITLAGAAAVIAIVAALAGYVTLARFLATQIVWIGVVVALLALLSRLADVVAGHVFSPDHATGRWLMAGLGFSRTALTQTGILVSGIVRLLLVILAIVAIAAPWGFDTLGLAESAAGLFYGVTIGSIRITFSTIIAAVALFVAGIIVTRLIQGWLENRLLPNTDLDPGLRASIKTGIGYLGLVLAAIVAGAYVGLDFASIALIAGALSVGIGFGLQSIVNNFVSGLILLAERPIRPGDWIDVDGNEGTVRHVNVRSTEIETFDRATVIIPNSSMITGVVTNRYLHEKLGRIIINVGVSYGSDANQVRDVLLECARNHPKVVDSPSPYVLFADFGPSSLDFELRAYLADISDSLSVRSDMRFAILDALREAGIEIPFPQRDINIRDLDRIENAISSAAGIARSDRSENK